MSILEASDPDPVPNVWNDQKHPDPTKNIRIRNTACLAHIPQSGDFLDIINIEQQCCGFGSGAFLPPGSEIRIRDEFFSVSRIFLTMTKTKT
jgi:hypothetical protein